MKRNLMGLKQPRRVADVTFVGLHQFSTTKACYVLTEWIMVEILAQRRKHRNQKRRPHPRKRHRNQQRRRQPRKRHRIRQHRQHPRGQQNLLQLLPRNRRQWFPLKYPHLLLLKYPHLLLLKCPHLLLLKYPHLLLLTNRHLPLLQNRQCNFIVDVSTMSGNYWTISYLSFDLLVYIYVSVGKLVSNFFNSLILLS